MESLQERKRKSSGSECVVDKLSKIEFFSRDNPWLKCLNSNNKSLVTESSIDTEKTILSSDEECSVSSSGISSIDGEEHDKKSPNLQSLEPSHVNITTSGNGEKSSDEVPTNTETMVLKSPEKGVANSSVIDSKENGKHNEESTKPFEPDHKDDKKSTDKPADSSANTSMRDDPHEVTLQTMDLASFAAMSNEKYSEWTDAQLMALPDAIAIRESIKFFLTNGYFEESFIKIYKHIYEMFVKFFYTNLKHLTPINHGIKIFDKDESKNVMTDSLFKDDDGRIFMYLWTTTGSDIGREEDNEMRTYLHCKANAHRHILEKPKNEYNLKISDMFAVRLNPCINEAQIEKFDHVDNDEILQQMIRDCRESI